ncbi:MAG: lamin tail domain-containing protein, partial [Bacteroidota bacterium]
MKHWIQASLVTCMLLWALPTQAQIVISEINYNADGDFDAGDWVELYNAGSSVADLSGWRFTDDFDNPGFTLPNGTTLDAGSYLVLVENASLFTALHAGIDHVGDFGADETSSDPDPAGFGLSNSGEALALYDAGGALADSVKYKDSGKWPSEADGDGSTLILGNLSAHNLEAESWGASLAVGGSPGAANGTALPFVRITSPEDGTEFTNQAVALEGTYRNVTGAVTGIEIEAKNTSTDVWFFLGTASLNAGQFTFSWSNAPTGEYELRGVATDGSNTSKSNKALIRVFSDDPCLPAPPALRISEINYKSPDELDAGDWFELFNPGSEDVDLTGWIIRDEAPDDPFEIPALTPAITVPAGGFLVLVRDSTKFQAIHPSAAFAGSLPFKLGGNDMVRVFSPSGCLVDDVDYDNDAPWPTAPDGQGPTLSRINPAGTSARTPDAWGISGQNGGSPSQANVTLPVELTSFTVEPAGAETVLLTWTTATETNNAGFFVERRAFDVAGGQVAGSGWMELGFVEGAGTTVEAQTYRFQAGELAPGRYAFRLRQVDFDGTTAFSPSVEVRVAVPGVFAVSPAYPNPFSDVSTVVFAVRETQPITARVFDL